MRKIYLTLSLLSMISPMGWGAEKNTYVMESAPVMKAVPIYSNKLIDEAPAGEVVTGIRNCWSSHFEGGINYRDFEKGVVGEYVIGEDGNVYLRAVCYSAAQISSKTDTYLKLEKVDDTTYVAHTPQLIWVDESTDGSVFTAYATRLVFTQYSATSFGYTVQQDPEGAYDTNVYFTLKDGKLMQKNMNTFEMNEEIFPEEIIGFTNSAGSWIGFGDGCIEIYKPESAPVALPENAVTSNKSLDYTQLHVRDIVLDNAALIDYAEAGDEIYMTNPSSKSKQWIKGTIDRENGTATFKPQYLGLDEESGYAIWFTPASYTKYIEVFDEETGGGDWFRTYKPLQELVLKYGNGELTGEKGQAFFFSHSPTELLMTGVFADPSVKGYESASLTPAPVTFTKFEEYDDLWGFGVIGFGIPSMSEDGCYINPEELYYNVFVDGSEKPFVFSSEDYIDMVVEPMTDVPYLYYEDFDFKVSGVNHTVYFYHDWTNVGVQVVQKHDGKETRSEIRYAGKGGLGGVNNIPGVLPEAASTYKVVRNGEVVIVRNGEEYNMLGMPLK